ncbi:hypothetical protein BC831DRAFT_453951 [Entophlyctis helioformis]|nr:hypothetical protein BC831DRAFT_453951 [Entophlyctis helioformis]
MAGLGLAAAWAWAWAWVWVWVWAWEWAWVVARVRDRLAVLVLVWVSPEGWAGCRCKGVGCCGRLGLAACPNRLALACRPAVRLVRRQQRQWAWLSSR